MAGTAVGLIVFGDMILFAIIAVVAGYSVYLFWRRCQKDRVIIRDLTSNPQVVPAEPVVDAILVHEPQVPRVEVYVQD